jgi:hypothetical protein
MRPPGPVDRSRRSLLALPLAGGTVPGRVIAEAHPVARLAAQPPPEVRNELPAARLVGSGRMTFFLFHVYDAHLWSGNAFNAATFDQAPLALELVYARTLYGELIAERSIEEMKRSADIAPEQADRWLAAMKRAFPDVNEGDRLTGVQVPGVATRVFANGRLASEIRDAEFTRRFFGIWLSPHTSEPKLRDALLARSGS